MMSLLTSHSMGCPLQFREVSVAPKRPHLDGVVLDADGAYVVALAEPAAEHALQTRGEHARRLALADDVHTRVRKVL